MKIRSTSLAMAAMMSAGFLAAPIHVLAKAPEMPQGVYAQPFAESEQVAAKEKHYDLKWELKNANGSGAKSMAADNIEKVTAVEKDGKWTFTISIKPASSQFIAKFYYYKDDAKLEAQQKGNDWSFTLDKKPEEMIKLAFAISVMQGKEPDALLEISAYKEIKGEASQEPGTPEQKPKEETALEKAKKVLDAAIQKAKDADKDKWDVKVVNALKDSAKSAGDLLQDASAREGDLALKESELNFLLALGEKTKGMDDAAKQIYEGFLTGASDLNNAKFADKGALKKNLDKNAALLKAADTKEEDLKKAGDAFALFMGNLKPADDTDIGNLKALIEKKKKVDPSSYTEKSQKELKDLLETASSEVEKGNLTKGRVRDLEAAINSWHGELKAQEKPKDDKKDEKKKGQTIRYDVPVELVKSDGSKSMASSALSGRATVDAYRGNYTYYLQFKPMKFGEKEGRLTNLFYYENGRKYQARYHGGDLWSFTLGERVSSQKIAVWVDIMDEMAGGTGKGEQEAYVQFNWYRAQETKRFDGEVKEPEKRKEDEKKKDEAKKIDEKTLEQKKKDFLKLQLERERNVVLNAFDDVNRSHWALDAIAHSYGRGYFKGEGQRRFAPNRAITRGEFVSILARSAGVSASKTSTGFSDVSPDAYYAVAVAWAANHGIVEGTGAGRFEPNREITREEMAVILDKFLLNKKTVYPLKQVASFNDTGAISSWAKSSVEKMVSRSLLSGVGNGRFAPKDGFSRAQAAQVLYVIDQLDER